MRRQAASLALAGTVCTAFAALAGCGNLQFVQDRRLSFTAPAENKLTKVPVTVSWTMKDFTTSGDQGGQYAVFLDKAPIKVGQNVRTVLAKNVAFSEQQLEAQHVYVTKDLSVVLTLVPKIPYLTATRQRHTATVVLLDSTGTRRTESAWIRDFDLIAQGV